MLAGASVLYFWEQKIERRTIDTAMNVYLSKDQMLAADNEEEAVVYVALKVMFDKMLTCDKDKIELNFNIINLFYEISGSFYPTKTDIEKFKKGIEGLINAGVVNLIEEDGKGNYVLDIAGLKIKSQEAYTVMTREEIRSVFNIPCKQKFNLLRFAVGIFGTINSEYCCGFASFKKMSELTGIKSIGSCQSHFKLLESSSIIYVCHSNQVKRDASGEIKNLSNCYGRPCDQEKIKAFYLDRCNRQGHDFTIAMGSSRKAKLTRNYNKYINGAYKGDIIELIKECLVFNRIPYNKQNPDWQKDITVFDPELIKTAEADLSQHIKLGKEVEKQKEKATRENGWAAILNPEVIAKMTSRAEATSKIKNYDSEEEEYDDEYMRWYKYADEDDAF